jgi:hypothetical protein
MKERKYTLQLNALESGALLGLIMKSGNPKILKYVKLQLIRIKREMMAKDGVRTRKLSNGLIESVGKDGFHIVRPPYDYELEFEDVERPK